MENIGESEHPPHIYSFNKSSAYNEMLEEKLKVRYKESFYAKKGSPKWVSEVNKEVTHCGRSPLLVKQLLSPSSAKGMNEYVTPTTYALLQPPSTPRHHTHPKHPQGSPAKRKAYQQQQYTRKTHAHRYLAATPKELPDGEEEDTVRASIGRPTRATLLRYRDRCHSAPVASYETRKKRMEEQQKVFELRNSYNNQLSNSLKRIFSEPLTGEETYHSFLTGARYNSARYLDAASFKKYGVYMPRNDPRGTFLVRPASADTGERERNKFRRPFRPHSAQVTSGAVPSPAYSDTCSRHPTTPQSFPEQPYDANDPLAGVMGIPTGPVVQPAAQHVWGNKAEAHVQVPDNATLPHPPVMQENQLNLMKEMLRYEDDLNIKGKSLVKSDHLRPASATAHLRPSSGTSSDARGAPSPSPSLVPSHTGGRGADGLEGVTICGTSIGYKEDAITETLVANQPPPLMTHHSHTNSHPALHSVSPRNNKCVGVEEADLFLQQQQQHLKYMGVCTCKNRRPESSKIAVAQEDNGQGADAEGKAKNTKVRFADEKEQGTEEEPPTATVEQQSAEEEEADREDEESAPIPSTPAKATAEDAPEKPEAEVPTDKDGALFFLTEKENL